ncbi:TetR/AcrR family transcriptional regulator [Lapidilactobacillus gannanensis]|uniref:TetR/AcrR family transcriptional regulator n=1 Tax=Lapidilactobacillus gannanensis TaxID=2486002 RepID=A0ABW4BKS9_9LACO|nr:TetR/AcrR family transcriptional regulator [Lapidilactobacillus gannanensis]
MTEKIVTDLEHWYDVAQMPLSQRKVLSAAIRLFARDGFSRTSTKAVAEEAGVSQAVLFKYFHSKDELLHQITSPIAENLIPNYATEFLRHLDQQQFATDQLQQTLNEVAQERFQFMYQNKEVMLILFSEFLADVEFKQQVLQAFQLQQNQLVKRVWRRLKPEAQGRAWRFLRNVVQSFVSQLLGYFILVTNIAPQRHYDFKADLAQIAENVYRSIAYPTEKQA